MFSTRMKLAAFAVVASVSFAVAQGQGLWPNWPIVGGAAYCSSYGNNSVCTNTVPAGPTSVTGDESIPGNTNLGTGNQSPQNVLLSMRALNAAPAVLRVLTVSTSADTYTIPNNKGGVVYSFTTNIPSAAVTAPASPMDGQRVLIASDKSITTFSFIANTGQTLAATTPTNFVVSTTSPQGYEFMYFSSTAKWYRIR